MLPKIISKLAFLATQQINLGEPHPHFIELNERELLIHLWEKIKFFFKPDLTIIERFKASIDVFRGLLFHPLFTLDSQSVSLFNIFTGICLFLLCFKYSRMVSNKAILKFVKLSKIDETSAEALKKIVYYFVMSILSILILDICHVPITIFTVIGGALAIGIGLGTQNISNDFISGLIIMLERPFKIGDIIEIDDSIGFVKQIGTRCTFIQNEENKNIIVPNSELLKKKIINWSCNGQMIKISSTVKVYANKPVSLITQTLELILLNHPDIINDMIRPQAHLTGFDDKCLIFEMSFLISLEGRDRKEIIHQVYTTILQKFSENHIKLEELSSDEAKNEDDKDDDK